MNIRRW